LAVRLDGTNDRYPRDAAVLEELARQLSAVGLEVAAEPMPKAEFFPRIISGESELHVFGWAADSGDAGEVLEAMAHSRAVERLGSSNTAGLADPELDALIVAARGARSVQERLWRLRDAGKALAAHRAYLPLYVVEEGLLMADGIEWEPPVSMALEPARMKPR
jgi:ABC-type oligopeptide transport system substrate-binding subunit